MLGSLLFAAGLMAAEVSPLDATTLKAAIQDAKQTPAAAPVGRAFKIAIPFVDGRKRNMPTFQSPARWVYDYKHNQLDLIIGPGEVTSVNYDQFASQGLDKLPPLQSFVFDSREATADTLFSVEHQTKARAPNGDTPMASGRGGGLEVGTRSYLYSFAIAAPYDGKGVSGLPSGLKPLAIHKVEHLPQSELRRYVSGMTLVLEGQVTELGQQPPAFCGGFKGAVTSKFITEDQSISVYAKQCFVTARIDRVTVMRGGEALATWPRPPAAANYRDR